MPLINVRELLQFPAGDNETDTVINGVHFNRTALELYNYTIYTNNTISNSSKCYLIFDQYQPVMFSNGSWVNGTSCYFPYYGIQSRGAASIALASVFAMSIMFTLLNLRKHGKLYLREDKRFRVVGRRWQWYWMAFVAACGAISCITAVDVDRDYLQSIALILQSFFFCLMLPGTLAMVWEATRHWGSWQERQIVDSDPYGLPQDDRRSKTEFWLPLVFYLFAWLNFFMVIPRSWTPIERQRSPEQQRDVAVPSATDARHKAGAILAAVAWSVIVFSLHHSLKHYKPRSDTFIGKINGFCRDCPTKLFLAIIVLAIRIAYAIAAAWDWDITVFKFNGQPGWAYGLGYGTTIVLLVIFEIAGFIEPNEDRSLIEQRRRRGQAIDTELGIVAKPHWWSKLHGATHMSDEERMRALAAEVRNPGNSNREDVSGPRSPRAYAANVELGDMRQGLRDRSRSRPGLDPYRDHSVGSDVSEASSNLGTRPPMPRAQRMDTSTSEAASTITGTTVGNTRPQQIRSMLDI
ncbi:hypothetical protein BDY21DRAFT_191340 [Lineolata rhizophorae]|uniref:Uncharacterized protein n=1 Tax=Lineolata rhizophorae TaxID=578093 RepID=A0A6A6P6H9_9PEZI|nr:hypothetical protein BDY21DRAFT_191340 [Lineolata rhizophorae]